MERNAGERLARGCRVGYLHLAGCRGWAARRTGRDHMNREPESESEEMLSEYDFSEGVRGKYAKRFHQASNVVVLEPDVAERFPNSEAVNQALRSLAAIQDRKRG